MDGERPSFPRDRQAQRTRWELRAILLIVVVVIAASLIWRSATHHPATPEGAVRPAGAPASTLPAAGAGVPSHSLP